MQSVQVNRLLYSLFVYFVTGVKGLVRDEKGNGISDAMVAIVGRHHGVFTTERGEYWRILLPGNYTLKVGVIQHHDHHHCRYYHPAWRQLLVLPLSLAIILLLMTCSHGSMTV